MARRRNVYALRQILAKDVNDQNDFRIADFQHIIRDVIGASNGTVSGLAGSYVGQVVTITSGSITDGETIFELLVDTNITIPTTNGTYKIYAQQDSTNDLPISGFKKIDIETGAETYDTVNSRTYDSITLGYTTGTIPVDSEQVGTVIVSGGIITSYSDARTFITIGNLTSYSLQNFAVNDLNEVIKTGYFSLKLGDLTNNYAFKADALNTNATTLFKINNGTNASNIGFEVTSSGNISYKSINGSNSTGFFSLGSNITNTIGFKSNNNLINYDSTLLASTTGLKVTGVNNSDKGIYIVDTENGIIVENESQITGIGINSKNIHVKSGSLTNADNIASFMPTFCSSIWSDITETGIGFVSNWLSASTLSETFIGFRSINNAKDDGSIGFASFSNPTGNNDVSSNNFEVGMASYFSTNSNFESLQNKNTIGFKTIFDENGDNNSFLDSVGYKATLLNETTGIVLENDGTGDNTYGIIGASSTTSKFFKKFIEINNAETGIDIIGNTTNSILGLNITNNTDGIKILGKGSLIGSGISIDGVNRAIQINNFGSGDVTEGLLAIQTDKPIVVLNNGSGGFYSNEYAIKLDLNYQQFGLNIIKSKGSAIKLENIYSQATFMSDIEFSNDNTNVIPHATCRNTPTNLPISTYLTSTTSVLQFFNNGTINQLKFYDGTAWKTVTVT